MASFYSFARRKLGWTLAWSPVVAPPQPTVLVSRQSDGNYMVKVRTGKSSTSHVVSVPDGMAASMGAPSASDEQLVRASFTFLLDREPASSILPKFGLEAIARYFPEYPRELSQLLQG